MIKERVLTIPNEIYDQMIDHAKSIAPIESCGYLGGKEDEITTFYQMTNTDNSPEHFTFDPKEQFQVVKQARNKGEDLLAVYHSHPASPARLSAEDIKLFNDPNPVYIIVSLHQKIDVKGYTVHKPDDKTIEINQVIIKKENK